MSLKKPLVLANGELEQLQPGDTILQVTLFERTNGSVSALPKCTPVYATITAGEVQEAQADAAATKDVLGLVADTSIAASADGAIQSDGVLEASTAEWDAVTGEAGGLTPGDKYYLDAATAGMLTRTVPSNSGEFVAMVGVAISTTELEISIRSTVKL